MQSDFKKKLKDTATFAVKLGIKELIVESWIKIKTIGHQIGVRILGIMPILKVVLKQQKIQDLLVDFAMFVVREDIVHRNIH